MRPAPHLLLALLVASACSRAPQGAPPTMPPLPVTLLTVTARDLPATFEYLGRTEGSREIEIRARVSGFLEKRAFVEGHDVAAGDLLFELDARPLMAQKATAEADLATAEARVAQAAREAKRLRPLVEQQAVSAREADDAEAAERIARAELAAAQARLQQIGVDLGYTKVTAPIAGRIGRALLPEGSLVAPTADGLLTTLVQLDPIYVRFQRSERQQQRLDRDLAEGRLSLPSGAFTVQLRAHDGSVLAEGGSIDFSSARLDPATGTIPLRATLPNPGAKVLSGQAVTIALLGAIRPQAIAVPQRAVLEGPQGKIVMVAVASTAGGLAAQSRPIEVGEWLDLPGKGPESREWLVTKGLAVGDRVILDNLARLRPDAPVVDQPATARDAAPTSNR